MNYINNLYSKSLSEIEIIDNVVKYLKSFTKEEIDEILNNDKLFFNVSRRKFLISTIKQVINVNINDYGSFVKMCHNMINDFNTYGRIQEMNKYTKTKDLIIKQQYNNFKSCFTNSSIDMIKYYDDVINDDIKTSHYRYRKYPLIQKVSYNTNFIFYSYFCYFKAAINVIINNKYFKQYSQIDTDTPHKLIGGVYYNKKEFKQIGGSEMMELLCEDYVNISKLIDLFMSLTNYTIGLPGIKYYPHQILQEIMNLLDNSFTDIFKIHNNKISYIVPLISNCYINKTNNYDIINEIKKYLINRVVFVACPINDPLVFNNYTIIKNRNISYDDIKMKTEELIKQTINKRDFYKYPLFIDNYYLESFCVIENIKDKIDFHSVYVKIKYKDKRIKDIIRYDVEKIKLSSDVKPYYFDKEIKLIVKDDYVCDYFDGVNNYKICLLTYIRE